MLMTSLVLIAGLVAVVFVGGLLDEFVSNGTARWALISAWVAFVLSLVQLVLRQDQRGSSPLNRD